MVVTADPAGACGVLRAGVLAAFSAVLTAAGHVAGGGRLPDLTVLVVLLPLLAGLFTTVAERLRTPVGTIVVLGAGQLALHELIELLSPAHATHHAMAAHYAPALPPSTGAGMLAIHALATLVTAVALRFADRAIAAVGAALRRAVRRPPVLCADRPLATLAGPGPAVTLRLACALAAAHVRRGPPVGC